MSTSLSHMKVKQFLFQELEKLETVTLEQDRPVVTLQDELKVTQITSCCDFAKCHLQITMGYMLSLTLSHTWYF